MTNDIIMILLLLLCVTGLEVYHNLKIIMRVNLKKKIFETM